MLTGWPWHISVLQLPPHVQNMAVQRRLPRSLLQFVHLSLLSTQSDESPASLLRSHM